MAATSLLGTTARSSFPAATAAASVVDRRPSAACSRCNLQHACFRLFGCGALLAFVQVFGRRQR
jgi:hypothetical protein